MFVDPINGDYHLQENSPCIDAGDSTSPKDPDGTRTDMGAYYFPQEGTTIELEKITSKIVEYGLSQNYPNPFNPVTTIKYQLSEPSDVTIRIFNMTGQVVKTIFDEHHSAGYYSILWNGRDDSGKNVASGVYFYQLRAKAANSRKDFVQTRKMVLVR